MRWKEKIEPLKVEWYREFAFLPTFVDDTEEWVWLEYVWRREKIEGGLYYRLWYSKKGSK